MLKKMANNWWNWNWNWNKNPKTEINFNMNSCCSNLPGLNLIRYIYFFSDVEFVWNSSMFCACADSKTNKKKTLLLNNGRKIYFWCFGQMFQKFYFFILCCLLHKTWMNESTGHTQTQTMDEWIRYKKKIIPFWFDSNFDPNQINI